MSGLDRFIAEASSVYWWVSVVVVGLVINLVSSYLKGPIDRAAARAYTRYKERKQRLSDAFDREALRISTDRELREWTVQEETRLYFKCLRRTLLGIWIMGSCLYLIAAAPEAGAGSWIKYVGQGGVTGGLLLWFDAGSVYQRAYGLSVLLRRAREIFDERMGHATKGGDVSGSEA